MVKEAINYVEIDPRKPNNRKQTFYENSDVFKETNTFSMTKNEVQDTVLEIDLSLESPVDKNLMTDIEIAKAPAEVSAVQRKKTRRRNRWKKRPNALAISGPTHEFPEKVENSDVFKETNTFPMTKNEVQDTVLEIDSSLQSPVDKNLMTDIEIEKSPAEVSAVQRKKTRRRNRRKKRPNALEISGPTYEFPEKVELSSTNHIIIVSTQGPVKEHRGQENDYKLNGVQSKVQELVISAEENFEESKSYCGNVKVMLSPCLVQKQENSVESCKDSKNALSQAVDNVSIGTFAKLSDKRPEFIKRVRERNVMQASHNRKTFDSTSDCHPSSKQMTEEAEKFRDKLERSVEDSLVLSEKIPEVSLAESKSEEKILSSVVDVVVKHVSVSAINEKDNLLDSLHSSPQRSPVGRLRKRLLILDLNGLLADIVSPPPKEYKAGINIAGRAIFKRPFCSDFLNFCLERFDVGIWSSRTKKTVERVIDYLMGDMKHKVLFCWDLSHCTQTGFNTLEDKHKPLVFKELRKIWEKYDPKLPWEKGYYNESNTLLLDDSPYKALLNPPHTAILPYSYKFQNRSDNSLGSAGDLRVYLEELAAAENIQKFVEKHPFGQSAITERSSSWDFYLRVISRLNSLPSTRYGLCCKGKRTREKGEGGTVDMVLH